MGANARRDARGGRRGVPRRHAALAAGLGRGSFLSRHPPPASVAGFRRSQRALYSGPRCGHGVLGPGAPTPTPMSPGGPTPAGAAPPRNPPSTSKPLSPRKLRNPRTPPQTHSPPRSRRAPPFPQKPFCPPAPAGPGGGGGGPGGDVPGGDESVCPRRPTLTNAAGRRRSSIAARASYFRAPRLWRVLRLTRVLRKRSQRLPPISSRRSCRSETPWPGC